MKYCIAALLLALLLTGCASAQMGNPVQTATDDHTDHQPSDTAEAAPAKSTIGMPEENTSLTEPTAAPALVENSAWVAYGASEDALGVIVNEPFSCELAATVTWYDGEYERAYIIPRYVGSYVNLYPITWDETTYEECVGEKADQSVCAEDGCIIFSELVRPEGIPCWRIEITAPDNTTASLTLTYNGRTGTPTEEYLYEG